MIDLPAVGAEASLTIEVSDALIRSFAEFSGDRNPMHLDDAFARERGFSGRVAHGMSYASFLSTLIGMHVPGPGALWMSQVVRFIAPVYPGDRLHLTGRVAGVDARARVLRLAVTAQNAQQQRVLEAECEIMVPRPKSTAAEPAAAPKIAAKTAGQRVVLLAGASGDLGCAIAKTLARQGFAVGLAGRNVGRLTALAAEVEGLGAACVGIPFDLCDDASTIAAVDRLEEKLGAADIVVHAASAPLESLPIKDVSPQQLARHVEVQAGGLLRLFQRCSGGMLRNGAGHFIYVGSTVVRGAPAKGLAAYAAGKAAAASLVKSIAVEYAPQGIRANIVSPYFLETRLNATIGEKARHLAAAQVPMRRLADLNEIADAVAFLASDAGRFINGHDLVVDGGRTMV